MNVSVSHIHKEFSRDVAAVLGKQKKKRISIRNLLENKLFPNCLPHVDIQQWRKQKKNERKEKQTDGSKKKYKNTK